LCPRHFYLWNIGCQMNRADATRASEELERRGYAPTRQPEQADLLILNTCVVRQSAEDKVIGRLNSLRNLALEDGRALLVMGCFVGDGAELAAQYPFVDGFLPLRNGGRGDAFVTSGSSAWGGAVVRRCAKLCPPPRSPTWCRSATAATSLHYCLVVLRR
jgi:tRNA A37 methylthiotransferase MiaB